MDKSWMMITDRLKSKEYVQGVQSFIEFATKNLGPQEEIRCPCVDCLNGTNLPRHVVRLHLIRRGIACSYRTWVHHGERVPMFRAHPTMRNDDTQTDRARMTKVHENVDELPTMLQEIYMSGLMDDHIDEERTCSERHNLLKFMKLFDDAQRQVYPQCEKFSILSFVIKMLQLKDNAALENCPTCTESRYKLNNKTGKKIPHKILRYFPLTPRLKRLYMSKKTAAYMRWHKDKRMDDGVLRHPADSEAWKDFDRLHPTFSADPRNCMKDPFVMMSLLIPGRSASRRDIDVYLQPLVEELTNLWEHGVQTYDASNGQIFTMHAAVMWTINDFPAYGSLSGWSTKCYLACPYCNIDASSQSLRSKIGYISARRYLPENHIWRRSKLFNGEIENRSKPVELSGEQILQQINLGTYKPIDGKNKDTDKARLDLEDMRIRKELHLIRHANGSFQKPSALYTLSPAVDKVLQLPL
ncbi:uncharacterized protein LOC114274904 [Camellia sinensis]|uniref:uncharacterized protein LOC114274904 n=1 Tax=Camellia sinensis TaxID=4442 RepID=UPI001036F08B|nr:uncharacterized protein LOC114274904 [Camellia sinensis]